MITFELFLRLLYQTPKTTAATELHLDLLDNAHDPRDTLPLNPLPFRAWSFKNPSRGARIPRQGLGALPD